MKAGLKQLEVFKMTGIDRSRLSLIENGWIDPKQDEIKKIEKVISAYAKTE
jgi:predicted transcriptional regulator